MTDSAVTSPGPVDRSELLQLLESEIDHARAEVARGGWTSWAVGAGCIAAVGFALKTWEQEPFSIILAAKWLILLSMPIDAFASWVWQWSVENPSRSTLNYRFTSDWEPFRIAVLWWVVRSCFMVWVVIHGAAGVNNIAVGLAIAYYAVLMFAAGGMFGSSFLDLPVATPKNVYTSRTWITSAVIWSGLAFVAYSYGSTIPYQPPGSTAGPVKLAAAVLTFHVLLFRLLFDLRQPARVERLVRLRRDLVLGKTDVLLAARSVEVTLEGASGRSAVEEFLLRTITATNEHLYSAAHARLAIHDALTQLDEAETKVIPKQSQSSTPIPPQVASSVYRARELSRTALRLGGSIQIRMRTFEQLIQEVQRQAPADLEDVAATPLPIIAARTMEGLTSSSTALAQIEAGLADIEQRVRALTGYCG